MAFRFSSSPVPGGLVLGLSERRALRASRAIAWSGWPASLGKGLMRSLRGLVDEERAQPRAEGLFLPHATICDLPAALASSLGLPARADITLSLRFEGRIETDGRVRLEWKTSDYRSVRPTREGALLELGGATTRLGRLIYDLCEACAAFDATAGHPIEERVAAWAPIQSILKDGTGQEVSADGYAGSLTFYQAGAFALDIVEKMDGPDFTPVLMRRVKQDACDDGAPAEEIGEEGEAARDEAPELADALLPEQHQAAFVARFSAAGAQVREAYVLGRNTYVVIPPDLKVALDVVRAKRAAPREERRAFLRNPRAAIAAALEQSNRAVAPLFVETSAYSERVEGLGLWDDIVMPPSGPAWEWLPEEAAGSQDAQGVEVTPDNVDAIVEKIAAAEAAGQSDIEHEGRRAPIEMARAQAERILRAREDAQGAPDGDAAARADEPRRREGLIIKGNIDDVEFKLDLKARRPLIDEAFPRHLMSASAPKAHQLEGFDWLVSAWNAGWPGVLLADDMGLGKTYQALAFLAWVRSNLLTLGRHHPTEAQLGPLLVVAPTSLLRNWMAEARLHLAQDGLGAPLEAFGASLKAIKRRRDESWTPEDSLDVARLRDVDWILTTYETLADNHRAFARVPYSVIVFDEIQKIKEPGSINTRSAKTLNADFVLGLTGTPIENRLEDLWSIFDRIAPGHLGALRDFSKAYGAQDRTSLAQLKAKIDQQTGAVPAPMLRRMKDRMRDGLPAKLVSRYETPMPPSQAQSYGRIIEAARQAGGSRRGMLECLQRMRAASLHPDRGEGVDPSDRAGVEEWLSRSARLAKSVEILRQIAGRGEKAIVFVDDLTIQQTYAQAVATLFDLDRTPARINGSIAGEKRQKIVDEFQCAPRGFDLLVLSPRAAGVGLTITAANHVVHLSRWWNPAVEDQCNDRAYRIGQTRDVTIHLPLAIHPDFGERSFDRTLDRMLEAKRELSRDMLTPPESQRDASDLFEEIMGK